MSLFQNLSHTLNLFENERKVCLNYIYAEHMYSTEEDVVLIIVFSKQYRENSYFMVSIFCSEEEVSPEGSYFERILNAESIHPFRPVSYHVIVGERAEGEHYSDHTEEILQYLLLPDEEEGEQEG